MKLTAPLPKSPSVPTPPMAPAGVDRRRFAPVGGPSDDGLAWLEADREHQWCLACKRPMALFTCLRLGLPPMAAWLCVSGCRVAPVWMRPRDAAWAAQRGPQQSLWDEEVTGAG